MTAACHEDPNVQILRALGITQQNVLAADLCLRPGQLPRFMVDCLVDPDTMLHEVLSFDLVPRPADPKPHPAFDLDALCAQARTRLAGEVDFHATTTLTIYKRETVAIRSRLDKAIEAHKKASSKALASQRREDQPRVVEFNGTAYAWERPTRRHYLMDEAIKACLFQPGEFLTNSAIAERLNVATTVTNFEVLAAALARAGFTPGLEAHGDRRRGWFAPAGQGGQP